MPIRSSRGSLIINHKRTIRIYQQVSELIQCQRSFRPSTPTLPLFSTLRSIIQTETTLEHSRSRQITLRRSVQSERYIGESFTGRDTSNLQDLQEGFKIIKMPAVFQYDKKEPKLVSPFERLSDITKVSFPALSLLLHSQFSSSVMNDRCEIMKIIAYYSSFRLMSLESLVKTLV